MKRTVQMTKSRFDPKKPRVYPKPRVSRNRVMPSTLGVVPIPVRTMRAVGGVRHNCRFTRKANSRARRAGYPDAGTMLRAMAKLGGFE